MITKFNPAVNAIVSFALITAAILVGIFVRSSVAGVAFAPNWAFVMCMASLGTGASFLGRQLRESRA